MQLILDSYGAWLGRKRNMFEVRKENDRQLLSTEQMRSILLAQGVGFSSDAMKLAVENEIEVLFVDKRGQPFARVWSPNYGSITEVRRKQVDFCRSREGLEWAKNQVLAKVQQRQAFLHQLRKERPGKEGKLSLAIKNMHSWWQKLCDHSLDGSEKATAQLRSIEGQAGSHYWKTLGQLLKPPFQFEKRGKSPADNPFHALLNYYYGMLYGHVEGKAIIAGIDPYLGIIHGESKRKTAFVFDAIEFYRVWAEKTAYKICYQQQLSHEGFEFKEGEVQLNKEGKKIAIPAFNEHLMEVVEFNGIRRGRLTHLQEDMYRIAEKMRILPA